MVLLRSASRCSVSFRSSARVGDEGGFAVDMLYTVCKFGRMKCARLNGGADGMEEPGVFGFGSSLLKVVIEKKRDC